ncbi:unnamed protein product, partial [Amoebophrya sp. A25]
RGFIERTFKRKSSREVERPKVAVSERRRRQVRRRFLGHLQRRTPTTQLQELHLLHLLLPTPKITTC